MASSNGTISIFDITSPDCKLKTSFQAHDGAVWKVDFSHPQFGCLLLSCGFDKKVFLWREINNSFDKVFEYNEHTNSVTCASFSQNSTSILLFASGSLDGYIGLHQYKNDTFYSEKIKAHDFGVNSISFSKVNPFTFVSCGNDNLIKIWNYSTENGDWVPDTLDEVESITKDVAFREKDVNDSFASCSEEGTVSYWTKQGGKWSRKEFAFTTLPLVKLSWNDNGNILVAVASDGKEYMINEEQLGN